MRQGVILVMMMMMMMMMNDALLINDKELLVSPHLALVEHGRVARELTLCDVQTPARLAHDGAHDEGDGGPGGKVARHAVHDEEVIRLRAVHHPRPLLPAVVEGVAQQDCGGVDPQPLRGRHLLHGRCMVRVKHWRRFRR